MKIQLPAGDSAPPDERLPTGAAARELGPDPHDAPPASAASTRATGATRGPRSITQARRPARHADTKAPAAMPASSHTSQSLSGLASPCGRYGATAGDAAASLRAHSRCGEHGRDAGKRSRRAEPLAGQCVRGEQHEPDAHAGEIRIGVAGHGSTLPRFFVAQSWNAPS